MLLDSETLLFIQRLFLDASFKGDDLEENGQDFSFSEELLLFVLDLMPEEQSRNMKSTTTEFSSSTQSISFCRTISCTVFRTGAIIAQI